MSSSPSSRSPWLRTTLAFYVPVTVLAVVILVWRVGPAGIPDRLVSAFPFRDLALGVGVGLLASVLTRLLALVWSTARELESGLSELLGPLEWRDCLVLAAASGIGEELFFRAALQPELGLVPTSLLFGLVHFPMERRLLAWPFLAAGMGMVLGGLFVYTGAVLAPVMAHGTVNALNLRRLGKRKAERDLGCESVK